VGDDENAQRMEALLDSFGIVRDGIIRDPSRITTEKQRVIASSQQLLRIDHEITEPLSEKSKKILLEKVKKGIDNRDFDALLFEDYAKGVLDTKTAEQITKLAEQAGIPVGIDPHPGHPIEISGITLMTPNRSEAFGLAGIYQNKTDNEDELEQLNQVAHKIQKKWNPQYLLITLGSKGMALFEKGETPLLIPTRAREVFDVSGAGDTVIATFTLALLAGATPAEAVDIANHAAGVVVGKVGTVSVTKEELFQSIKA
jgi:D-beta-D-heptose 7-phosphate kinase/D-beta-D-heptose 1-phosphate adenosyltransferase